MASIFSAKAWPYSRRSSESMMPSAFSPAAHWKASPRSMCLCNVSWGAVMFRLVSDMSGKTGKKIRLSNSPDFERNIQQNKQRERAQYIFKERSWGWVKTYQNPLPLVNKNGTENIDPSPHQIAQFNSAPAAKPYSFCALAANLKGTRRPLNICPHSRCTSAREVINNSMAWAT